MAGRPWPVTNSVRCAVEGVTAAGVNTANIFWLNTTASGTPTTAQANSLAQAVYEAFDASFLTLLGKDWTLKRCVVNYYGVQPIQVAGIYESDEVGGSANNTEIDSLSAVVSWVMYATWRGGKPRTYLPALPTEAFTSPNRLHPTFIAAVLTQAGNFKTSMNGISVTPFGGIAFAVQSFFSGNVARTPPVMFAITDAKVHPRISSQRRRLGKEVP